MKKFDNLKSSADNKELRYLAFVFITLAVLTIGFKVYNYYNTKLIHKTTENIYNHPLKVSNTSMDIKLNIYKIHRDMKDVVLSNTNAQIDELIKKVNSNEHKIYDNFKIIEKNILGEEGLKLEVKTRHLFAQWKPIRDRVISLMKKGNVKEAVAITKGIGADHVIKLEKAADNLYRYARNKADNFKEESYTLFSTMEKFNLLSGGVLVVLFIILTLYTIRRMYRYMYNNEKLTDQLFLKDLAFKHSVSADIMFNNKGVLSDVNNAFNELWGYGSYKKLSFIDLLDSSDEAYTIISSLKRFGKWEGEFKAKKSDGTLFDGYGLGNGIINKYNETIGYHFTILDISQRKEDERLLKKSEKRFKTLIGNLPGMAYKCQNNKKWTMEFLSESCISLTGYPAHSLINNHIKSFNDIIHPDDKNYVWEETQKAIRKNQHFILDYRIIRPDGEVKWVLEHGNGIYDDKGECISIEGVILDNHSRKTMEEDLIENESKFRSLFEHSFISIWNEDLSLVYKKLQDLGREGVRDLRKHLKSNPELLLEMAGSIKVNHVNSSTLKLFKAESEKSFLDNIATSFGDNALDVFTDELCAIWEKKRFFLSEAKFKKHDGEQFDALISFTIPDLAEEFKNLPVSIVDISDRKNMEKKLNFNKYYLEKMFHIIPNLLITTKNGEIDRVNDALLEFTDTSSIEEFKKFNRYICNLFDQADMDYDKKGNECDDWIEEILSDPFSVHKISMVKKNKTYRFLVKAKPLNIDENDRNLVIFTDITEIEETYGILKKQEEIIISQSRHAAMGEMISMIAHQWRQPISVISMAANNILADIELDSIEDETLQETAKEIVEQTIELSKTIDDFRDFFKPDKEAETVNIKDILAAAFNVVGKSLENNNIKIKEDILVSKDIHTYARELMQVFINILKNSKDALVENNIQDRFIEITIKEENGRVEISINDNGGGIPEKFISKIFDPYFSTKSEKSGTGLGLYMCKEIIEKHLKGSIEVKNTNLGAAFYISLPFEIEDNN